MSPRIGALAHTPPTFEAVSRFTAPEFPEKRGRSSTDGFLAFSAGVRIVVTAGVVLVPVLFRPLEEFKVVLELALDKALSRDRPVNIITSKISRQRHPPK